MQYRFQGDVLQLIRYRIGWTETTIKWDGDKECEVQETQDVIRLAASEKEKDLILQSHPDAAVEPVSQPEQEWMDGLRFTQEQRAAGEVERAEAMGETAYNEYLAAVDRDQQILDLDYRLSCLELCVTGGELR